MLGQHRPREDATGVAHEVLQERVLARRQRDAAGAARDVARGRIEREIGHAQNRLAPRLTSPHTGR